MTYTKPLLAGGLLFFAGYCTGNYSSGVERTLETTVEETIPDAKGDLFSFLEQHKIPSQEGTAFSLESIWKGLPPATKRTLLHQLVTNQVEDVYEEVKGRSEDMYAELKHYLHKQLGGK